MPNSIKLKYPEKLFGRVEVQVTKKFPLFSLGHNYSKIQNHHSQAMLNNFSYNQRISEKSKIIWLVKWGLNL